MNQQQKLQSMIISALLCAIGIIIPMFAPKIVLEPASFTLASHVPVFIAMFISPVVAITVALITGLGFLFSGFPIIIVFRALTHIIFAFIGAFILKKSPDIMKSTKKMFLFSLIIGIIHALCEVIVVTFFYFGDQMTAYQDKGYLISVIGLVGLGTVIHSMIDFGIAIFVWNPLQHVVTVPVSVRIMKKN